MELGSEYGYFLESSKSILAVRELNKEAAEIYFADLSFTIVTGAPYLGGSIGEDQDQAIWIAKQAKKWTDAVGELAYVAENHPQVAYAGLQKLLQQEWQVLQQVMEGVASMTNLVMFTQFCGPNFYQHFLGKQVSLTHKDS